MLFLRTSMSTLAIMFLIAILAMSISAVTTTTYATTGMGTCRNEPEGCTPQKDRVGADDDEVTRDGPDEGSDEANCWGKVVSDVTHDDDGDGPDTGLEPGEFGQHAANPTGDEDNDTPREGVGNQDEDHPSDHADTVGPNFGSDEECTQD